MNTTAAAHPVPFEQFKAAYLAHLGDPDGPTCYVAYCRAEADMERDHGARRYANYKTFANTMSRHDTQKRLAAAAEPGAQKNVVTNSAKVPVKCQICDTELYTVPRGDLRTIIPHFCEGCRDEIRKIIFV